MMLLFHNCMALIAIVFFVFSYRRVKGFAIGFALYIYMALFPYRLILGDIDFLNPFLKILLAADFFLLLSCKGHRVRLTLYPLYVIIGIIACGIIASVNSRLFNSRDFTQGLVNICFVFFVIILLFNRINDAEGIRAIFSCMCCNGIFLSLCATIDRFVFLVPRVELSMLNPNYYAFYMALVLCVAIYLKKKLIVPILLFGIYLSKSGAVLIGLVLSLIVVSLSKIISKRKLTYITMTTIPMIQIAGLFLVVAGSYLDIGVVMKLIAWKDSERIGIWIDGMRDFISRPLFGYGYNCWRSLSTDNIYMSHNDLLRILVDCGIVGIIIAAIGWIKITKKISKSQNAVFYLSLISLIAMFSSLHNNLNSYMCWFFLMLVIFDKHIVNKNNEPIIIKALKTN